MRSRLLLLAALLALMPVLAGCYSATPALPPAAGGASTAATATAKPPAGHESISITDTGFTPATLTVKVGAVVTWTNAGGTDHTVAFDDGTVKSSAIKPGTSAFHVFSRVGAFPYHDSLHPTMTGTVTVTK